MDILGEGAGWSSFTVRERGEKGTHVRDQIETFFSPQLILQRGGGQWFYCRENYTFPRIQRGSNIFRGGPSKGGSKC